MKKTKNELPKNPNEDNASLDHQYGKIGISAVAAAMRYQSGAKNPAYAPVVTRKHDWDSEAA